MTLRARFRPDEAAPPPLDETDAALALGAARGRAAIAPPPRASKAASAALKPLLKETGLGLSELKRRWADIAGESFARATPEKLTAGVLVLKAPGALAPFLQQQAPLLIERLLVAGARIKAVRIEQRTAPPKPAANIAPLQGALSATDEAALAASLGPVTDPALRSALLRLGRAVKRA
jgi:hypothetical protein